MGWANHGYRTGHSGHNGGRYLRRPHASRLELDGWQDSGSRRHECRGQLSVAQTDRSGQDVEWAGAATRIAKNLGVAKQSDVQAIVDDANAQTAVLRNKVIGTQQFDIRRAPTRLFESAMGNMVADAMRLKYPGVDAAYTNSGGLRSGLLFRPPSPANSRARSRGARCSRCCRSVIAQPS